MRPEAVAVHGKGVPGEAAITPTICAHCGHELEVVDRHRRFGRWLALLLCPRCRSEYFYALGSGSLVPRP